MGEVILSLNKSVTAKAFLICFISVHLPLIAIIVVLVFSEEARTVPVLVASLVATAMGTVFALIAMRQILRPLDQISEAIKAYGERGEIPPVRSHSTDEVGRIAKGVEGLIRKLNDTIQGLKRQAMTDPLTGVGNRRWLVEEAGLLFERARREDAPVTVLIFDLDHFKRVNDQYGHEVGDVVLMAVAEIARHKLRPYDRMARFGGEEFCVVTSGLSPAVALEMAERLRLEICQAAVGPLPKGGVTASFGLCTASARDRDFSQMLRSADEALYVAKAEGRNRSASAPAEAGAMERVRRTHPRRQRD